MHLRASRCRHPAASCCRKRGLTHPFRHPIPGFPLALRDGGASFSPLLLYGAPGTTFTLRVTSGGIVSAPVNVSVAPCATLEQYDLDSRLCNWCA